MTDSEIAIAALRDWPIDSHPAKLYYQPSAKYGETIGFKDDHGEDVIIEHAVSLFIASGITWLLTQKGEDERQYTTRLWHGVRHDGVRRAQVELVDEFNTYDQGTKHEGQGETLLACIDKAIRSLSNPKP